MCNTTEQELKKEYEEFLETEEGKRWKENDSPVEEYDFGRYLYDFYPELLM